METQTNQNQVAKEFDRQGYIVLAKAYEDSGQELFYIIRENKFEEKNFCETYDNYGQKLGCENAGCYSRENSYCELEEGEEENHITVKAYDYWNGHNWQSIIIEHEHDLDTDFHRVIEEKEEEILQDYFKDVEGEDHGTGLKKYEGDKYDFYTSMGQGHWWEAEVVNKGEEI